MIWFCSRVFFFRTPDRRNIQPEAHLFQFWDLDDVSSHCIRQKTSLTGSPFFLFTHSYFLILGCFILRKNSSALLSNLYISFSALTETFSVFWIISLFKKIEPLLSQMSYLFSQKVPEFYLVQVSSVTSSKSISIKLLLFPTCLFPFGFFF